MLDITLWKDAKYGFSIGRVIDVSAGKKIVDNGLHFFVTQYLTIGNGSALRKAKRR